MRAYEFIAEIGISQGRNFRGSPCKTDCSGHSAGYTWAKSKNIRNKNQCPVRPTHTSFTNGCRIAGDEEEQSG